MRSLGIPALRAGRFNFYNVWNFQVSDYATYQVLRRESRPLDLYVLV